MTTPTGFSAILIERDEAVETAVSALLDVAVVGKHGSQGLELHCKMCGLRNDNHTSACPVPLLEEWAHPR